MQGLIERDTPMRQVSPPVDARMDEEIIPGQIQVIPVGEGAKIGTYECVYWTGTFRIDDRTGAVRPDVIRSRYTGASPGIRVYLDPRTKEWRHDNSQWLQAHQAWGHIRVDGVLGDMPDECSWSGEAYDKYVAPIMTKAGLAKIRDLGVVVNPRALARLSTALPKGVNQALMPARGDTPDDVKRKRDSAAKIKKALADFAALVKEVWG